ncbi:uncharacterized protein LOC143298600 [Babylonia areolata]|uniref:uncharacterized protein LOC143298600 n=1 Tax=Babylonia areolata TaxID=304850 RepID=UPI003FD0695B
MSVCPQPARTDDFRFSFWRPRRSLRYVDPVSRCRPSRLRTSAILCKPVELTVKMEVEKFKFYGKLRPTETHVHNSLPSSETIQTEKTLMSFEKKRKTAPESALYNDFYRSLTSSITPLPSGPETLRSSRISSRGPDTPKTTMFTPFPDLPRQGTRLVPPTASVVSRLVTSYGRSPSESRLDVLRPAEGVRSVLSSREDSGRRVTLRSMLSSREDSSRGFSRADSEPNSHCYSDMEEDRSSFSARGRVDFLE